MEQAPVNLIVNLKRFDKFGTKIKANINYPNTFDLGDFEEKISKSTDGSGAVYELYAVINHEGRFSNRGHYNCNVKGFDENWYSCDDSTIINQGKVHKKSNKAYILFYKLSDACKLERQGSKRRISDASTNDIDSDALSVGTDKPKSIKKVNRKRARVTKELSQSSNFKQEIQKTKKRELKSSRKGSIKSIESAQLDCGFEYRRSKRCKLDEDKEFFQNQAEPYQL